MTYPRSSALPAAAWRPARRAAALVLCALACGGASAIAEEPSQPYSLAERNLFMTDHLGALPSRPSVLSYRFVKSGSFEGSWEDKVTEEVGQPDPATDNGRPVHMEFLTGAHKLDLPAIEGAKGNPVIMGFLERDVREMSRITGGGGNQGAYYKKRLRMAMVEVKDSQAVTVKWQGHDVAAQSFTLDPYKDDPARSRYTRYANKTYTFVLSDAVPGGVYSMQSVMRDPLDKDKIMIEETLTLTEKK